MRSLDKYWRRNIMTLAQTKLLAEANAEVLQAVLRAVTSVQQDSGFGSIEITVHEGRVTQIEKREKLRLQQAVTNHRK